MYPTKSGIVSSEEPNSSNYTTPNNCPECGSVVKKQNARFCTNCGQDFTTSRATPGGKEANEQNNVSSNSEVSNEDTSKPTQETVNSNSPVICPQCGYEQKNRGKKFCTNCGSQIPRNTNNSAIKSATSVTSTNKSETATAPTGNQQNTESSFVTPNHCPQCGTKVKKENAKFCTNCGRDFTKTVPDDAIAKPTSSIAVPMSNQPVSPSQGSAAGGSGMSQSTAMTQQATSPQSQQFSTRPKRYEMVTPNDVRPVSTPLLNKTEMKYIGFFALMGFFAHLFRYFIMFDAFPNLYNLLVPIPFYAVSVLVIIMVQKFFIRDKGLEVSIDANRFDFTRSLVMSTFFLTLIPARFKIDQEKSNVPERIYVAQDTQDGSMVYNDISRSQYLGSVVRPRMHLIGNFILTLFALGLVIAYFNSSNPDLQTVLRLVSMYVASFVVVELAPIYGRNNGRAGEYGRIRTLLVFFLAFLLFLTPLLGENFFVALQNLNE